MVDEIRKLAAKFGNEEVFKWAIWNDFYFMELFEDDDLFLDVTKKGHLRVLEIAHSNTVGFSGTAEKFWRMLQPDSMWSSCTLFSTKNQMSSI
jgi:ribosomal protein S18 acetylase RimI-like enzyme